MPKHPPHGHIQPPTLLLVVYSLLVLTPSPSVPFVSSSTCRLTWSVKQTLTRTWTNTQTPVHTQTDGEVVRGYFAGCWREQRESAEGGGEREQEKREGTQREERKCVIGGGKTKREKERVREGTMLREGMDIKCKQKCVKKKKKCVLKYTAGAGSVCINIATC